MGRKKGVKTPKPEREGLRPAAACAVRSATRRSGVARRSPAERQAARQLPPAILVRKLQAVEALERLEFQLRSYARQGQQEVLVVHGKGQNSPGGVSVLGPLVRQWCDEAPHLVESWREAPLKWGGSGAIVVVLKRGSS